MEFDTSGLHGQLNSHTHTQTTHTQKKTLAHTIKNKIKGTREMIQCLRALDTLLKDPELIPSTYMAAHNSLYLQFQDIRHAGSAQTYMQAKHAYIQNKISK